MILGKAALLALIACPVAAAGTESKPADPLDACNVVWDSPSKDSGGSMPLGNGDIGLNAWVEENGDLVFFISKTDSWTDSGRLVKLGQVRVRLTPSLAAKAFHQELKLRQGQMVVRSGAEGLATTLRLWVDANRPVIHIEGESKQDMQAQVGLYVWRTTDRDMQKESNIGYLSELNTGPVMEKADTVLPQKDNRIVWYHRNEGTIVPLAMKLQGMESLLPLVHDPILRNTFGGAISGKGMVPAAAGEAAQALKTAAPTSRLDIAIHVLGAQTDTAEQWVEKLNGIVAEERKTGLDNAWQAHCTWWQEFWSRSWIQVHTPEDAAPATAEQVAARVKKRSELQLTGDGGLNNHTRPTISDEPAGHLVTRGYALQRFMLAAACRGAYPAKHDGSIFTVNSRKRDSLADADYRNHGANYWFLDAATTMYGPMLRSGDYDLLMPLFKMYSAMVPMARERTKLQYHHEGIYIPATVYAWGTYQENEYVRWLWHGGLELTAKMLDYCEATGDDAYLRETVLPLADGVITFYDQHWKRDDKGKIRMDPACALECAHEAVNPQPEIAGLRYVLPRLLALPEKVTTAAQHAAWKKTLADVPEIPMATLKDAATPEQLALWKYAPSERPEVRMSAEADKKILVAAGVIKTWQGDEVPDLYAVFPYRLYAFDSKEADIGRRTFERWNPPQPRHAVPHEGKVGGWRLSPIQAAFVGKAEQAARMVTSNFAAHDPGSRFPAFWGPAQVGLNDQSQGGVSMTALQAMLLQVDGKKIYLFPAWPKEWDVNFKLHALYNTTVEGELHGGKVVTLKVTPKSRAADVVDMLEEGEIVKDRGNFIPKYQYPALKGKSVGVLVGNPLDAIRAQEGGSGSADALVFSTAGGCYRWVYVPVKDNPAINNLDVCVGEKGDEKKVFTSLDMANAKNTKQWGVQDSYVLVEMEVNDKLGSPRCDDNQGFVATKMRQLDGTPEFPLKVEEVVVDLRKRYKEHLADQEKTIAAVLAKACKDAIKDAKPNGPRQREETMYVTWLPDKECLVVRFRTTITDGAYTIAGRNIHHETGKVGSRVGTSFGIEFGQGYEVSKTGKTTRVLKLPIQSFTKKIGLPVESMTRKADVSQLDNPGGLQQPTYSGRQLMADEWVRTVSQFYK